MTDAAPSLWPLPGTGTGRRAVWLSVVVVAVVALSRVALLADGPWEQDEAIFAAAVVDFDVLSHRPHPPGFPGWVAIGKLVHLLVADAHVGLQLASAAASIATFVVLASLLGRLGLPGSVALSGALLYMLLPGIWAHGGRAFSTTPALFFLVAALWCVWRTRSRLLAYLGWASFACALAVRPQLLIIVPLWLLVTLPQRWWRTAHGWGPPLVAATLLATAVGWLVIDSGGVGALMTAVNEHGGRHFSAISDVGLAQLADLGWVRGLGGSVAALAWVAAAILGGGTVWRQAGARVAAWLGGAVVAAVITLWLVHDPFYPRYSLPFYLATLPLVAYGVAAVTRRHAAVALAALAALAATVSLPAVWFMARNPLPVVAGLRHIAARSPHDAQLVYSLGLLAFTRWEAYAGRRRAERIAVGPRGRTSPGFVASLGGSEDPFVWLDADRRVLPGITVRRRTFAGMHPAAHALSQRRFDRVEVIEHAPVWLHGRSPIQRPAAGRPYAWLGPKAAVWLPPGSRALRLSLAIPREFRDSQVIVISRAGRRLRRRELADAQIHLAVDVDDCARGCTLELELARSTFAPTRGRWLAARVEAAWVTGFPPQAYTIHPGSLRAARALGARLQGFAGPAPGGEPDRRAAWTGSRARIDMPGAAGVLRVMLAAPHPLAGPVTLRSDRESRECPVGSDPRTCEIRVVGDGTEIWLEIEASPLVPRDVTGSTDPTELGAIVYEIAFQPEESPSGAP